jgi:hypothetical protein
VGLKESELIGLAPLAALLDVAAHAGAADESRPLDERLVAGADAVRLRDFSPLQALELRLAAVAGAPPRSLDER